MVVAWAAVAAWLVLTARTDLIQAQDDLGRIREDTKTADLLADTTTAELDLIGRRLARSHDKLASPLLAPVRVLPVVGRQLRSADALAGAANQATAVAVDVLREVEGTVTAAEAPDTDRVAMLQDLASIAAGARRELAAVDLGPSEALFGPLEAARADFEVELDQLVDLLTDLEVASAAVSRVLDGPGCHLLLAANNAEMRAGSGMLLQAGELCFDGGRLSLGEMHETSELALPPDAVTIPDPDLAARWGFLLPNAEWRNLMLSPRFDASAELAADMWSAVTGRSVDGVLAVDPVGLAALLETTGPIEVDGQRYDGANVVEHLLVEQYQGFLDDDYDPSARKERLGEVAGAAMAAFDAGGWDVETLVERLPRAAAGRHLLAWSRDTDAQDAWEAMGVSGALAQDTIAVSILNRGGGRGGGKLDPVLDVDVRLSIDEPVGGRREGRLEVSIANPLEPGTPTYAENPDGPDVRFGVYEGILSINLPGSAANGRVHGVGLLAVGADGPTRVVAPPQFSVEPRGQRTFVVRFDLPAGLRSMQLEPSARIPATTWDFRGETFDDVLPRTLRW